MTTPFRSLPTLALILAVGASAAQAAPRLLPPQLRQQREQLAVASLSTQRAAFGLRAEDTFRVAGSIVNPEGQSVVRLQQLHDGARVWGAQAIVRVQPTGETRTTARNLQADVSVPGAPRLSAQAAVEAALKASGAKAASTRVETELVVFPAKFKGGLAWRQDPVTGQGVLDRAASVIARLGSAHVWAYEVRLGRVATPTGAREPIVIVDAQTGAVLRVMDGLHRQAAPATGAGQGFYRGAVSLPTSQMADGSFALYDTTRGLLPNPILQWYTPDGSGWTPSGMQVWYEEHDATGARTWNSYLFQSNPVNTWGDGLAFTQWGQENGSNGQSAGVDAMAAMVSTWDFFEKVMGRSGLDGQGTTPYATVLANGNYDLDNAYWSIGGHFATFGAGSYPANPKGFQSFTDLDVVAHEMTHGVTSPGYSQYWVNGPDFEESGLNEATSDFFSEMVKAYVARPAGAPDDRIPDVATDWRIGMNVGRGTPIRHLDKPSLDGRSADGWYDGIRYMDGHYSAGPINRALHFLAQGASPDASSPRHSVFLPGGMTGLGNDKAARIWFKTVTERLLGDGTGSLTMADARREALAAAAELHGDGSAEVIAVENAFAAANIGEAHGQGPRVKVWFAPWRDGDYIQASHYLDYGNLEIFPQGETVRPRITVEHTTNTAVTWSLGGPSLFNGTLYGEAGGVINPDGTWTLPQAKSWFHITARSQADPNQFAEGRVFLVNLDTDMDLEQDALDMAGVAFSWGLSSTLNLSHSVFNAPLVDNLDVGTFVDAAQNAWPIK